MCLAPRFFSRRAASTGRARWWPTSAIFRSPPTRYYGSLGVTGYFTEETSLAANSPYSASKAGADLLVRAYRETYGFPTLNTRCSNNYGPFQFPEKLIPLIIHNIIGRKPLPVYGDGLNIRDWLHVKDHSQAIETVLKKGNLGEVYNIGGNNEWKNIDIVNLVCDLMDRRLERPQGENRALDHIRQGPAGA